MSALTIVLTVIQVLTGIALTVIVLFQSGKSAGLSGAIAGGADTFLSKGRATPLEGLKIKGKCLLTVCNGKVVYRDPAL